MTASGPMPPTLHPPGEPAVRVLVVEDEQNVAEALAFLLHRDGFDVQWATTGILALRLHDTFHPDLVMLDLMLPGLDGLEVCRQLKDSGSQARIVMVTARDTAEDRERGLAAGAHAYVTKPYAIPGLRAVIHRVLEQQQAAPVVDLRRPAPTPPATAAAPSTAPSQPNPLRRLRKLRTGGRRLWTGRR